MSFLLREAEKIVCAVILLAMTALGFANVVVRYLTSYSLASTEELLTNGFLLLTVFGAAIAARNGEHLAVTILYDAVPRPVRRVILVLSSALSVALLAMSAWFTWQLFANQFESGVRSYALQIPAWYYSVALPFGFALVIIRYIQHAFERWRGDTQEVVADV
ncbi:TRAP transporter small permease [Afifella marina]|uniref:TRAP transporter small permease protein n=1 Tax=Afifella marina DSM 2698 TaxID=1120955 RepID=A0A1G5P301_AFIMA|nr:TRAP transporter small permease [Afifella marina]MBK1624285.1 TRAP transporter small permease [Afifella marina DSM 2698]MBK1628018.1 TRAP transporter small permease [Afifella marina]MBK5918212.1 C4-dicarboxylate ABC transporter permease [Afifella marina]RAI19253.1 C4-dicarboxylate ABC transporter permease [Afifella marina DSM 2698]SCZ43340.1 TRAP-type C4-dicarboxylate transport system, small permease component [Afifella marina DSM 2698]